MYCHSFTVNDVFEFLRRDPVLKKSFSVPHHSNSRLTHKIQKTLLMSLSDFVRHLLAHSPYTLFSTVSIQNSLSYILIGWRRLFADIVFHLQDTTTGCTY
jgi:hypothetical protein